MTQHYVPTQPPLRVGAFEVFARGDEVGIRDYSVLVRGLPKHEEFPGQGSVTERFLRVLLMRSAEQPGGGT